MKYKKIFKKAVSLVMFFSFLVASLISNVTLEVAKAATGLNMNGFTIQGYAYTNGKFPVYNSTGSGQKQIGTCYGGSDYIIIHRVEGNGWSQITYPIKNGKKTGYCWTEFLFQNTDFQGVTGKAQSNITTYRKSDCTTSYGKITTGDDVFIIGYDRGNTQLLYPCTKYYKFAWVKGTYKIQNGILTNGGSNSSNTGLASPVAPGGKFNMKTNDNGWYGYHDINKGISLNTPVYAIADGTVTYKQAYRIYNSVKKLTSYGNFIEFQSSSGEYTAKYCHLNKFEGANQIISSSNTVQASGSIDRLIIARRTVKRGEVIGYIGQTGNASGVHLHFELYKNKTRIDPTTVINGLI